MPKQTFFNLPDEKRGHILDIAIREFAKEGYKHASISHMVAEAHIAKGSFYQYFEDKDDLYEHIIHTKIAQRKLAGFQKEKTKLAEMNLTQYLRVVFHNLVEDFMQQPEIMKIATELMQLRDEPIFKRVGGRYQSIVSTFYAEFIQHEIEQGEIDDRVNVMLLNFMLVGVGQYLSHMMVQEGAEISTKLICELVDDLELILAEGIYRGEGTG